jgi:hypothetical protein
MCPTSRGRIGGGGVEEGPSQSMVDGLRAAPTGGGGRRRGLDEIRHKGRVPVPESWLNELSGVQGCSWFFGGVLKLEEWGHGKRRGEGGDRRSLKGVAAEESGLGVRSVHDQVEEEGGVRLSVQQRQPVGNDPSMPATGRWAWLLKTEEVGHCHVGPMAQCQSAESNDVQLI